MSDNVAVQFDVNHLLDINTIRCGRLRANTDRVYGPISADARKCLEEGEWRWEYE